jgi:hypothetical protein
MQFIHRQGVVFVFRWDIHRVKRKVRQQVGTNAHVLTFRAVNHR